MARKEYMYIYIFIHKAHTRVDEWVIKRFGANLQSDGCSLYILYSVI